MEILLACLYIAFLRSTPAYIQDMVLVHMVHQHYVYIIIMYCYRCMLSQLGTGKTTTISLTSLFLFSLSFKQYSLLSILGRLGSQYLKSFEVMYMKL